MADQIDINKALLQLLQQQSYAERFGRFAGISDDYGMFGGGMPTAQVTNAPGQLAAIAPWVKMLTGIQLPDALVNKNFHFTPNTQTSPLYRAITDQNTANLDLIGERAAEAQGSRLAGFFGKNSAARGLFGDELSDRLEAAFSGTGGPVDTMLARMLTPMMSGVLKSITGYDVGEGVGVINAKSPGMVSRMRGLYGGFSVNGGNPEDAIMDVLGGDFENERKAASSLAFSAVNGIRFDRDEDGNIKGLSRRTHGASGDLVASIVTEAMANGAMEREMYDNSGAVRSAVDKKLKELREGGKGGEDSIGVFTRLSNVKGAIRLSDLSEEQSRIYREQDDISKQIKDIRSRRTGIVAEKKRGGASDEEASRAVVDLDKEIENLEKRFKDLSNAASSIGDLVKEGGGDLVESVTATVESMKDLYGSEEKAARALQMMVGSDGMTNKTLVKSIKNATDEYKLTAFAAGIDPTKAGEYLTKNVIAATKGWGTERIQGSVAMGQLGLDMSIMGVRTASGISDPVERDRYMRAHEAMTSEVGNSEGFKAALMLEYAKEHNSFSGDGGKALENRINRLMSTGNARDFEIAKKLIMQVIGRGNEDIGREIFNDPRVMADLIKDISPEGTAAAAEWATTTNEKELGNIKGEKGREIRERRAADVMYSAGFTQEDVTNTYTEADTKARNSWIKDKLANAKDDSERERYRKIEARANEVYKAALASGKTEQEAAAEANSVMYNDTRMTDEDRKSYGEASTASREAAAREKLGPSRVLDKGDAFRGYLEKAGAVGESGELTGENMAKFASSMFQQLSGGRFLDKNGKVITADEAAEKQKQYEKLIRENKRDEAYNLVRETFGSISDEGKDFISENGDMVYITPEQEAESKKLTKKEQEDKKRITATRDQLMKDLEESGLAKDGKIDEEGVKEVQDRVDEARKTYSKEKFDRLEELRKRVGEDAKNEMEELQAGREGRDKEISDQEKIIAELNDKKEKSSTKDLSKEDRKKLADAERRKRELEAKNERQSQLEKDFADKDLIAERDKLSEELDSDEARKGREKLAQDEATLKKVAAAKAQNKALETFDEKERTGNVDPERLLANAKTAQELAMDAENAYTAAKYVGTATPANVGKATTGERASEAIRDKEASGEAANAGVGQALENFLKDLNPEQLKSAILGTSKAVEEFGNFIKELMVKLDIPVSGASGKGQAEGGAAGAATAAPGSQSVRNVEESKDSGKLVKSNEDLEAALRDSTAATKEQTEAIKNASTSGRTSTTQPIPPTQ